MRKLLFGLLAIISFSIYGQNTPFISSSVFISPSSKLTQTVSTRMVFQDSNGNLIYKESPVFEYTGTSISPSVFVGYRIHGLSLSAGYYTHTLKINKVETNIEGLDNPFLYKEAKHNSVVFRIEYDLLKGNIYLSPVFQPGITTKLSIDSWDSNPLKEPTFMFGLSAGYSVGNFDFLFTPMFDYGTLETGTYVKYRVEQLGAEIKVCYRIFKTKEADNNNQSN